MHLPSLDKLVFVSSLLVFVFLYGIATQAFGWFPSSLVQRAWNQAEAISPLSTAAITGKERPPSWRTSRVYDTSGVRILRPEAIQPGLTLLTSVWESSGGQTPGLRIITRDGEVLHEWQVPPEEIFSDTAESPRLPLHKEDIQGSHLFPNGDVLVNVEYVGAVRLDACSRIIWKNSRFNFHHSIAQDDDGSFWVPGVRRDTEAQSSEYPEGYPGLKGPIHRSLIVHLTADGDVLGTINILDVLYKSGLHRHIPQAMLNRYEERPYGKDVVHMNDVEPLPDSIATEYPLFDEGDLVVSLRKPNLVFVLDPSSEKVKWHETHPFIHQHDPDFIGNGWIGVFDNNHDWTKRGTMLGGSRVVLVNPHNDSTKVVFPTAKSDTFYTNVRGKWQILGNGNLLLTESQAGRVVEVGPDGETVWEWIHEPSGDETVPSVTKASRLEIERKQVASWPCSNIDQ